MSWTPEPKVTFGEIRLEVRDATSSNIRLVGVPICPDLLRFDQLGEADNLRGRVVRGFFWLMRLWPMNV